VGPRTGLDTVEKTRNLAHAGDQIRVSRPSSPLLVALPTELSRILIEVVETYLNVLP
jgi:hypothetical protein